MSTPGINTSVSTLRFVIRKLAQKEAELFQSALNNIFSDNFHKSDQMLVELSDCKFQLELAVKSKWYEIGGLGLETEIERCTSRIAQLERYFNSAPESDYFELKTTLLSITNELFDLKRNLHQLEQSDVDFDLPIPVTALLMRLGFINSEN
jgi:hypothetical protein